MSSRIAIPLRTWAAPALMVLSTLTLTGCMGTDEAGDFVDPAKSAYYEQYPIKVVKAPVQMGVAAPAGILQPDQLNAVANFARNASADATSRLTIKYPSGSSKGRQAAADAAAVMVSQGIPREMIVAASYPGGPTAPLQLSYEHKVAVTKACGQWPSDLASTSQNTDYTNFGCAYQNNIAAMVADAEDFEHPRAESAITAAARVKAMTIYFGAATEVSSTSQTTTETKDKSKTENNGGTSGN